MMRLLRVVETMALFTLVAVAVGVARGTPVSAATADPGLVVDGELPSTAKTLPGETVELWILSVRTAAPW